MTGKLRSIIVNLSWGELIAGALIGLILTSFASPALNPNATRIYERAGLYSPPSVHVGIEETGAYYPVNSSVEDYEGLEWKEEYTTYRILIRNDGDEPVEKLKFTWRAPGCVVYTNTEGPAARGHYSITNRGTYGVYSDVPLSIGRYQCTMVIEVVEGELSPDESIAAEFVVTSEFEKCDFLIDLNPRNLHLLTYTWEKNGVLFDEQRPINPPHLEETYQEVQETSFIGTQESLTLESGNYIHSFIVGVRGESLDEAIGKCVNSSEAPQS